MTRSPSLPWQRIAAPDRVRRHCPTTPNGMPIPYITEYSRPGDDAFNVRRTPDGPVGQCACVFGVGQPRIGKQCVNRQRQCMSERLCSVCGQGFAADEDMVLIGVYPSQAPIFNGETMFVTGEAPTHDDCAAYSLRTCPHLITGLERGVLVLAPSYTLIKQLVVAVDPVTGAFDHMLWPLDEPHHRVGALSLYLAVPHESSMAGGFNEWLDTQPDPVLLAPPATASAAPPSCPHA